MGDDCHCPSSSSAVTSSLDAPRFLLAAAAAAQHEGHIGELPRIDPDTQARIEALLEAAGRFWHLLSLHLPHNSVIPSAIRRRSGAELVACRCPCFLVPLLILMNTVLAKRESRRVSIC